MSGSFCFSIYTYYKLKEQISSSSVDLSFSFLSFFSLLQMGITCFMIFIEIDWKTDTAAETQIKLCTNNATGESFFLYFIYLNLLYDFISESTKSTYFYSFKNCFLNFMYIFYYCCAVWGSLEYLQRFL
jgi:hypothetical protein